MQILAMSRRNWSEFKQAGPRLTKSAIRASLNPKGEFTFDLETYRRLEEPEAMVLLFDRDTDTIGLRPASPNTLNAALVKPRHVRSNRCVRSVAFLKQHDIRIDRSVRFPFAMIEDGVLILDLRTRANCGRVPWKPRKA